MIGPTIGKSLHENEREAQRLEIEKQLQGVIYEQ